MVNVGDTCTLCVLAVAKSATTYVRVEVSEVVDMKAIGLDFMRYDAFHPEILYDISPYVAGHPESLVNFAARFPRKALRSMAINHRRVGLWPDLVFAGTPICIQHIYWADEIWGVDAWLHSGPPSPKRPR